MPWSCQRNKRWEEAAVAWQQVLGLVDLPSNLRPQAHCALGDALQKLGQDESAAQHFRLAEGEAWTSAAGFVHVAQLRLANAWRRLGRFGGSGTSLPESLPKVSICRICKGK